MIGMSCQVVCAWEQTVMARALPLQLQPIGLGSIPFVQSSGVKSSRPKLCGGLAAIPNNSVSNTHKWVISQSNFCNEFWNMESQSALLDWGVQQPHKGTEREKRCINPTYGSVAKGKPPNRKAHYICTIGHVFPDHQITRWLVLNTNLTPCAGLDWESMQHGQKQATRTYQTALVMTCNEQKMHHWDLLVLRWKNWTVLASLLETPASLNLARELLAIDRTTLLYKVTTVSPTFYVSRNCEPMEKWTLPLWLFVVSTQSSNLISSCSLFIAILLQNQSTKPDTTNWTTSTYLPG